MKKVSVLIPVHNSSPWLHQCLESVLNQSWGNIEVVAVDDGSTDASLEILNTYGNRIRIYSQPQLGACAARNKAFKECTGDYIQYLDADDLLSETKIEEQVRVLESAGPEYICLCNYRIFVDGTNPDEGQLYNAWPLIASNEPLQWLVELLGPGQKCGMTFPAVWMFHKNLAQSIGPWNEALSQDQDGEYFCRLIANSKGILKSDDCVAYYRRHQAHDVSSISSNRADSAIESRLRAADSKAEVILAKRNDIDARRALSNQYLYIALNANAITLMMKSVNKSFSLAFPTRYPGGSKFNMLKNVFGHRVALLICLVMHAALKIIMAPFSSLKRNPGH